jgi:hypothetical protein
MTQDEIIEMANQARIVNPQMVNNTLEAFAKLVAQHERETCAEIAEKQRYAMHISLTSSPVQNGTAVGIANAIRARSNTFIPKHRTWVGLTDEELADLSASGLSLWELWRAIEAKLKEKNYG